MEWIRAAENFCAVGPTGTGKSHSLVAFGVARRLTSRRDLRLMITLSRGCGCSVGARTSRHGQSRDNTTRQPNRQSSGHSGIDRH
ncbi:hypothetical protein [Actinoallomurus sp. CA-142502]|uniref:hypothetical protein n=1 Tax=Actinoallomurus sp. CA-142502 TaxID=3239885 RepID=UPI003D947E06